MRSECRPRGSPDCSSDPGGDKNGDYIVDSFVSDHCGLPLALAFTGGVYRYMDEFLGELEFEVPRFTRPGDVLRTRPEVVHGERCLLTVGKSFSGASV